MCELCNSIVYIREGFGGMCLKNSFLLGTYNTLRKTQKDN